MSCTGHQLTLWLDANYDAKLPLLYLSGFFTIGQSRTDLLWAFAFGSANRCCPQYMHLVAIMCHHKGQGRRQTLLDSRQNQ